VQVPKRKEKNRRRGREELVLKEGKKAESTVERGLVCVQQREKKKAVKVIFALTVPRFPPL